MLHQGRCSRGWLDHGSALCEVASEDRDAAAHRERPIEASDDFGIEVLRFLAVLLQGLPIDRQGLSVKMAFNLLQKGRQATGVVEVLHQVFA